MDVDARGQHLLAVRQYLCRRWLVGDEGPDLLRMAGHQASAFTAPPLVAKMSTGPVSSAEINRCRSSACSSGVDSVAPSVRLLRSAPRGSNVTTVRSGKCRARVTNPWAPIGDPSKRRTGSSESLLRTS